jgi:hypothetical protein
MTKTSGAAVALGANRGRASLVSIEPNGAGGELDGGQEMARSPSRSESRLKRPPVPPASRRPRSLRD